MKFSPVSGDRVRMLVKRALVSTTCDFAPVASSTGAPRHSARLKSLERLSTDHIVSLTRVFDALRRRTRATF